MFLQKSQNKTEKQMSKLEVSEMMIKINYAILTVADLECKRMEEVRKA